MFQQFTTLAQNYVNENTIEKISLTIKGLNETVRASLHQMTHALDVDARSRSADIRRDWVDLEDTFKSVWDRILRGDDLLRNFYLNLYNDVTDMASHPQRGDVFRALFLHPKMLGGLEITARMRGNAAGSFGGGNVEGGASTKSGETVSWKLQFRTMTASEFYALLNADQPILSRDVKMANVSKTFERYRKETDTEEMLAGRLLKLNSAYEVLRSNLVRFQTHCVINRDLFRYVFVLSRKILLK